LFLTVEGWLLAGHLAYIFFIVAQVFALDYVGVLILDGKLRQFVVTGRK
jgi:hypothetical protein